MPTAYQHYLRCDCWMKALRANVLAQARYTCAARIRCSGAHATEAHHLTYKTLGREKLTDMLAVCSACHRAIHGIPEPAANDNNPKPVSSAQLALDLFGRAA